jgi:hypothetical protein
MYGVLERLTIADILDANASERSGGIYNLTIRGQSAAPAIWRSIDQSGAVGARSDRTDGPT